MSKLKYNQQQATITEKSNKQNSGCFVSHSVECAKTTKENPANFISNDFLGDYSIVCSAVDIASETYNKQEDDQKLQIVHSTTAKTKLTKLAPKTIGLKRLV